MMNRNRTSAPVLVVVLAVFGSFALISVKAASAITVVETVQNKIAETNLADTKKSIPQNESSSEIILRRGEDVQRIPIRAVKSIKVSFDHRFYPSAERQDCVLKGKAAQQFLRKLKIGAPTDHGGTLAGEISGEMLIEAQKTRAGSKAAVETIRFRIFNQKVFQLIDSASKNDSYYDLAVPIEPSTCAK
jgi:hypothetical protein